MLVAVYASPVAAALAAIGAQLGYRVVLVEPDARLRDCGVWAGAGGRPGSADLDGDPELAAADVVVTDHHRDDLGVHLRDALARPVRWVGIMGNPRHEGPHVAALAALGVAAGGRRPGAPADRPGHRLPHARRDRASPRSPACSPTATAGPAASLAPVTVVLGADLGTSGLKLAALDPAGTVVAEAEAGYPVDRPQPGWAQTDVAVWRTALDDALADAGRPAGRPPGGGARAVRADARRGAGRRRAARRWRPALLWPDRRAAAELDRWRDAPRRPTARRWPTRWRPG